MNEINLDLLLIGEKPKRNIPLGLVIFIIVILFICLTLTFSYIAWKHFNKTKKGDYLIYQVKEGDTLISISKKFFNNPNKARDIYLLNLKKLKNNKLRPGIILYIPKKK